MSMVNIKEYDILTRLFLWDSWERTIVSHYLVCYNGTIDEV